jgi:hypothetical protein
MSGDKVTEVFFSQGKKTWSTNLDKVVFGVTALYGSFLLELNWLDFGLCSTSNRRRKTPDKKKKFTLRVARRREKVERSKKGAASSCRKKVK